MANEAVENEAIMGLLGELGISDNDSVADDESSNQNEQINAEQEINETNEQESLLEANKQESLNSTDSKNTQSQTEANPAMGEILAGLNNTQIKALSQLGLMPVIEQLNGVIQAQNNANEQARRQAVFDENLKKLNADFPNIKPDELAKFANANELSGALGEDYAGWKMVAKAMQIIAKNTDKPDEIISGSGLGASDDAFSRLKKNENVSDIEIGAELLKSLGV